MEQVMFHRQLDCKHEQASPHINKDIGMFLKSLDWLFYSIFFSKHYTDSLMIQYIYIHVSVLI